MPKKQTPSAVKNASLLEKQEVSLTIEERIARLEEAVFGRIGTAVVGAVATPSSAIDYGELTELRRLTSVLDRSLSLLNFHFLKKNHSLGLTPDEIVDIMRERFGYPVPLASVSAQLYRFTGRYVTRTQISRRPVKYRYQILPAGQTYLASKLQESAST
jgi:hypothetical protein